MQRKTRVSDVARIIESIAPLHLAESWDRVGLTIGNPKAPVKTLLTALELTDRVLEEARKKGVDLLVLHHSPLFGELSRLRDDDPGSKRILAAIRMGLSVYVAHTNWDVCPLSMTAQMLREAGIPDPKPLYPKPSAGMAKIAVFCPPEHLEQVRNAMAEAGAGVIGEYDHCAFSSPGRGCFRGSEASNPFIGRAGTLETVEEERFEMICPRSAIPRAISALVSAHPYEEPAYDVYALQDFRMEGHYVWTGELPEAVPLETVAKKGTRLVGDPRKKVRKLAAVSGGGRSLIRLVAGLGMDCYLTGDIGHHDARTAEDLGLALIDVGHYESEAGFGKICAEFLGMRLFGQEVRVLTSRAIRPAWQSK